MASAWAYWPNGIEKTMNVKLRLISDFAQPLNPQGYDGIEGCGDEALFDTYSPTESLPSTP